MKYNPLLVLWLHQRRGTSTDEQVESLGKSRYKPSDAKRSWQWSLASDTLAWRERQTAFASYWVAIPSESSEKGRHVRAKLELLWDDQLLGTGETTETLLRLIKEGSWCSAIGCVSIAMEDLHDDQRLTANGFLGMVPLLTLENLTAELEMLQWRSPEFRSHMAALGANSKDWFNCLQKLNDKEMMINRKLLASELPDSDVPGVSSSDPKQNPEKVNEHNETNVVDDPMDASKLYACEGGICRNVRGCNLSLAQFQLDRQQEPVESHAGACGIKQWYTLLSVQDQKEFCAQQRERDSCHVKSWRTWNRLEAICVERWRSKHPLKKLSGVMQHIPSAVIGCIHNNSLVPESHEVDELASQRRRVWMKDNGLLVMALQQREVSFAALSTHWDVREAENEARRQQAMVDQHVKKRREALQARRTKC